MRTIIDRPFAVVYGPRYSAIHGKGLMYGLGLTRKDAWSNAVLVMRGSARSDVVLNQEIKALKKKGMVCVRVEIALPTARRKS